MRGYVFFGILCGFTLFRVTASRFSLFIFKKLFCLLHFLTLKNRLFLSKVFMLNERLFCFLSKKMKKITDFKPRFKKNA